MTTPTATATASPTERPSASATPLAEPTLKIGPPTFALTLTGDVGLAGTYITTTAGGALVRCNEPTLDGLAVLAQFNLSAGGLIQVTVHPSTADESVPEILVRAVGATGTTLTERDFVGKTVATFDPLTGATMESELTEQAIEVDPGAVGALTGIAGTIDCGGQTPGSTTIEATSSVEDFNGPVGPALVQCSSDLQTGPVVSIIGTVTPPAGDPWRVVITLRNDSFSVIANQRDGAFIVFSSQTGATVDAIGATVDADAVQSSGDGTVHIDGEAVCGDPGLSAGP